MAEEGVGHLLCGLVDIPHHRQGEEGALQEDEELPPQVPLRHEARQVDQSPEERKARQGEEGLVGLGHLQAHKLEEPPNPVSHLGVGPDQQVQGGQGRQEDR